MSARDAILAKLEPLSGHPAEVEARLAQPSAGPSALWNTQQDMQATFLSRCAEVQTQVHAVQADKVAETLARELSKANLPSQIAVSEEAQGPWGWEATPMLEQVSDARRHGQLTASLVRAQAAAAETGTLIAFSGSSAPSQYHFLPQLSFVLLHAEDLHDTLDQATRAALAKAGSVPRSLNFITGPSRTGDIEQTLFLGAHGPAALHLLLLS